MKKNITLAIVTLALAGLCCAISLITVRAAAPALLTSHLLAWAVGVVLLAVALTLLAVCLVIEKEPTTNHQ